MFCIKGAGLEKTSLAKVVGIFNKVKENKKFEPGNTRETPRKGAFTNVFIPTPSAQRWVCVQVGF